MMVETSDYMGLVTRKRIEHTGRVLLCVHVKTFKNLSVKKLYDFIPEDHWIQKIRWVTESQVINILKP